MGENRYSPFPIAPMPSQPYAESQTLWQLPSGSARERQSQGNLRPHYRHTYQACSLRGAALFILMADIIHSDGPECTMMIYSVIALLFKKEL